MVAVRQRGVVMAGHRQPGGAGGLRDLALRLGHAWGAGADLFGESAEGVHGHVGAVTVFRGGDRIGRAAQDRRGVVVEGEQVDATGRDVGQRRGQRAEVERLPPQMHPHVAGTARPGGIERVEQGGPGGQAAQPRFPGQGDAEKGGGDAAGEQLRLGFRQRDAHGEIDAGPRLDLPLEGITVQVDDAGSTSRPLASMVWRAGPDGAIRPSVMPRLVGCKAPSIRTLPPEIRRSTRLHSAGY